MAASTLTTFDAFLKNYYNAGKVANLTMAGKPLFQRVTKNEDIGGKAWIVPILYVNPQGIAANNLAQAQSSASNVQGVAWNINPMGDYFGSVSIGDKVLMASRNNIAAFLEDKTTEIDGIYESVSNSMAQYLWRAGGGAIGKISSGGTTTALTLTVPSDAFNFEVNQVLVASANDGTTNTDALLGSGATATVTAVDRINGIITTGTAPGSWANASFLFRAGDFVGNTTTNLIKGVDAYVTSSATPSALWGVTRTTDVQRLSGCKVASADVTGKGIEERIQLLGAYMAGRFRAMTAGGQYECYMHPEDWQNLAISLQSRGQRALTDDTTSFNFEFIEVLAGGKRLKVFADPYVVKSNCYILRLDDWVLGSYGELIRTLNGDGLSMLRAATTNDYEYRLQSYPQLACKAPGYQGRVALP